MQAGNRFALKEWAVVCAALATGRQSIILRKGGIDEGGDGFRVAHREFWLFPTAFHQAASALAPSSAELLDNLVGHQPPPGTIHLSSYAVVNAVHEIQDEAMAQSLTGLHILSADTVAQRFHYRRPGLFVLAVRVYNKLESVQLADSPYFAGCKSWIELPAELSTADMVPAMTDDDFQRQLEILNLIVAK